VAEIKDVIVVGGGQAGLVSGYFLNRHNLDYAVLDANKEAGGSWQHYYENLKLFSPARYGELPGLQFPGDPSHYPTRYEVIDYLKQYEATHQIPVERGIRVESVVWEGGLFAVQTTAGSYYGKTVISASGPFNTPYVPRLNGQEQFEGTALHSFDYHTPEPYEGQHVVVVGSRDSAMQIAYDLTARARVTMAVRRDLMFMPKYFLGKSILWWLHDTGYDQLPLGLLTRLEGTKRIVGREPYQTALKAGNPAVRPMFTEMTEQGVVWGDGEYEDVDSIIYATGFNPGLEYLRPLGALDEDGYACHHDGVSETVNGLFYVGLFGQRSHASATLRGVGRDARVIAERVATYVRLHAAEAVPAVGD